MNFVIGSHGRLGKKLVSAFKKDDVIPLERTVYENWWHENAIDDISYYFERAVGNKSATLFVASGILAPSSTIDDHDKVNYLLPKNLIQGASKVGIRTITFGTIMEQLIRDTENPYIASKIRLGDFISQFSQNCHLPLHIRIHTLYGGGLPSSFMFLGQMLQALQTKTLFKMSSGEQLREYHHIDDDIAAIFTLLNSGTRGITDISHGHAISLKKLATHVFNAFQCLELLSVGSIHAPDKDNYQTSFLPTASLDGLQFREPLSGVVDYLKCCII